MLVTLIIDEVIMVDLVFCSSPIYASLTIQMIAKVMDEMESAKAYNMIVLGSLLKIKPIVPIESIIKGLKKTLPERHHHLIPMNEAAINRGMDLVK